MSSHGFLAVLGRERIGLIIHPVRVHRFFTRHTIFVGPVSPLHRSRFCGAYTLPWRDWYRAADCSLRVPDLPLVPIQTPSAPAQTRRLPLRRVSSF